MRKTLPNLTVIAEILFLAGDIGYPHQSLYKELLSWASNNYTQIFLIAGNHEFYHNKIPMQEMIISIRTICSEFPNITFLNNQVVTVNYSNKKIRIFGATMWSNTIGVKYGMSDYNNITYLDETSRIRKRLPITPDNTTLLHFQTIKILEEILEENNIPLIVLTHHLPSFTCISSKCFTSSSDRLLSCAYASKCDSLIKSPIILWVHGHIHHFRDIQINNIRIVCNPLGYPTNKTMYNERFVITV